jgi:uncharacterized membrane protein YeaQ/YmgE (transglycosylase-associated protein family)
MKGEGKALRLTDSGNPERSMPMTSKRASSDLFVTIDSSGLRRSGPSNDGRVHRRPSERKKIADEPI